VSVVSRNGGAGKVDTDRVWSRSVHRMTRRNLAVVGGVATLVATLTRRSRDRKWQQIHMAAVVIGAVVVIFGAVEGVVREQARMRDVSD
jgi:hypothetical protein